MFKKIINTLKALPRSIDEWLFVWKLRKHKWEIDFIECRIYSPGGCALQLRSIKYVENILRATALYSDIDIQHVAYLIAEAVKDDPEAYDFADWYYTTLRDESAELIS